LYETQKIKNDIEQHKSSGCTGIKRINPEAVTPNIIDSDTATARPNPYLGDPLNHTHDVS
jgi:hypothetical protein